MSFTIHISILILNAVIIGSNFLDAKSNYLKPKLERNNVVNKRVWVKNKNSVEKTGKAGKFVFGTDLYDVETGMNNDMDEQASNGVPFFSNYSERSKRSLNEKNNETKNAEKKNIATNIHHELTEDATEDLKLSDESYISKTTINNILDKYTTDFENSSKNTTTHNTSRYEPRIIKKVEFDEELNRTFDEFVKANKIERDVFDKDDVWQQNPVLESSNPYKMHKIPMQEKKSKPVTERGLLKILSLLTKTFKKIMKQHDDVKRIHGILQRLNDEFVQNIDLMTTKFNDFDIKYMYLLKMDEHIRQFEAKFKEKEQDNKNKETELTKNMLEFANQQKKFLAQQQQFYNVQKLILMQNEKITAKQNMIARSQNEISRKQNNFARILKQVKQIFVNKKIDSTKNTLPVRPTTPPNIQPTKDMTSTESNLRFHINEVKNFTDRTPEVQSTTTDPMKINLFSIVPMKSLENNDEQILKEKDEKPVDDLIYKYYFNNTFIDNLIKNKILANFIVSENNELVPENKNKREHLFSRNNITFLFPVLNHLKAKGLQNKKRQKRWIRHHPKSPRKHRGEESTLTAKDDVKIINLRTKHSVDAAPLTNNYILPVTEKAVTKSNNNDPFRIMATNFCREIGQNINEQALKWCIEKALRRLKYVDTRRQLLKQNVTPTPATATITLPKALEVATKSITKGYSPTTPVTIKSSSKDAAADLSFPDNEELESFLQQYEIKPDTEGNVYYEGSYHTSDMGPDPDSEGASDIIPSLDNNSKLNALRKVPIARRPGAAKFF